MKECDKPIAIYGTGNGADKIIAKLESDGSWCKVKGIFASSGFVRDRYFHGIKVESYDSVKERLGDMIILVCFGSSLPEVLEFIEKISNENELYAPQVPVYGTDIFDLGFYEDHKSLIDEARDLMADDLSRLTFDNTVKYYLSGDIRYLKECECLPKDEYSLTRIRDGSTYLDLGAYNGDTVKEYRSIFPGIKDVIAVEPDIKNFKKLSENITDAKLINALISDTSGITHINLGKGRGVHEQNKGTEIMSYTVDGIINGGAVHLIKYDVEGNEHKALEGSVNTIRENKPVLHVACYHRSEDIFDLPLLITKIRPDYRIYLRHRPHLLNWDTQFVCL